MDGYMAVNFEPMLNALLNLECCCASENLYEHNHLPLAKNLESIDGTTPFDGQSVKQW